MNTEETEILRNHIHSLREEKYRYKARVNILLEENDLLKHILSINNIQLTSEVVQDAQSHLRELTNECKRKDLREMIDNPFNKIKEMEE